MRAATITTDAEVERSRLDTDLLILPQPTGSDIRDWKIYDPVVAAGHAAAVAALEALDGPIETLRKRKAAALDAQAAPPEPAADALKPRRKGRSKAGSKGEEKAAG
jgi:NTE family protein